MLGSHAPNNPPYSCTSNEFDLPYSLIGDQKLGNVGGIFAGNLHLIENSLGAAGLLENLHNEMVC